VGRVAPDTVRWQDSAALGAALFLNFYFLDRFAFPYELSASLPKLLALALAAGLVTAMAFYLGGRGSAASAQPLETALGKLLYFSVLLSLLAPLGVLAAVTIARAFLDLFAELAGYRSLAWQGPTSFGEQLILLAWAAWVASRGRAVVAASARLWALVFLVFLLGGCLEFWPKVAAYVRAEHAAVYWSDVSSSLTDVAAVMLPLSFLAGLCRRTDREAISSASSLMLGSGIGLMIILACLCLAGLSLMSPERGNILFYMLSRTGAGRSGNGRFLIVMLTMLPLMRIAALALTESFSSLRVPIPALAGFGCMAALAWADRQDAQLLWEATSAGTFLAAIAAGVLCGKGLAATLARRVLEPPQRRAAETFGVCAGLIVAGAAQLNPAWGFYALLENQPLKTYVAVCAVTSVVASIWPASPQTPGTIGRCQDGGLF
jgi:hypothetical protein